MPIYIFEGKKCGHRFEKQMSVAEMERTVAAWCPYCEKSRAAEVVPAPTGKPIMKAGRVGGFDRPTPP